jgi:2-hydroxychromene-2-carboxylate isomerase
MVEQRNGPLVVELYWSFRSPYSYVVLPRVIALRNHHNVDIELKIVHPTLSGTPHTSSGWTRSPNRTS